MLDGVVTIIKNGEVTDYAAGQIVTAGKDTVTHWFENRGKSPATFLAVQIAK